MIVPVDQRKAGNALVVWKWNVEKLRVITMEMNTGLRPAAYRISRLALFAFTVVSPGPMCA